jgi:hypothetical protein
MKRHLLIGGRAASSYPGLADERTHSVKDLEELQSELERLAALPR